MVFTALKKFPGPYIDGFLKTFGNTGLVKLLDPYKSRKAIAQTTIIYYDKMGRSHLFIGKVEGTIATKPRGTGFGWDPIFIPKGEKKTFGQMSLDEKNKYSMRAIALKKLALHLKEAG